MGPWQARVVLAYTTYTSSKGHLKFVPYRPNSLFSKLFSLPEPILPNFHFSGFPIFAVKLGHIKITTFFSYVTNTQAYQRKPEKFFVFRRKKFGRIDSRREEIYVCAEMNFFKLRSSLVFHETVNYWLPKKTPLKWRHTNLERSWKNWKYSKR